MPHNKGINGDGKKPPRLMPTVILDFGNRHLQHLPKTFLHILWYFA